MPEGPYRWFVYAEIALAVVTFVALLFIVAPYGGRHGRAGWGPTVPARVGWIVMEAPASILFVVFFTMLLAVMIVMIYSVRERTNELGVLKTLGFSNGTVLTLVLAESLFMAILAGGKCP